MIRLSWFCLLRSSLVISILVLAGFFAPQANAQSSCSDLFVSAAEARTVKLDNFSSDLKPLQARLAVATKKDPGSVLDVSLKPKEKLALLDGSLATLGKLQLEIQSLTAVSKQSLNSSFEELQVQGSGIQSNAATLKDALYFSFKVIELANTVVIAKDFPTVPRDQLKDPGVWQNWTSYQELFQTIIARRNLIPLPTHLNVSIRNFNYLLSSPVVLIGMVTKRTLADNILRTPWVYYGHDIGHAIQSHSFLSPRIWNSLFATIETWTPQEQAAAHALIFDMTHENKGWFEKFEASNYAEGVWYRFGHRLQTEKFYGESELAQVTNLKELIQSVAVKIDQAVIELKP